MHFQPLRICYLEVSFDFKAILPCKLTKIDIRNYEHAAYLFQNFNIGGQLREQEENDTKNDFLRLRSNIELFHNRFF